VRRLRRNVAIAMVGATLAVMASFTPAASQETDLEAVVCAVDPVILQRTWRGYLPERSGNIQIMPAEPDFVGQGGLPHAGPWDYIAKVPLVWYGPGFVAANGEVERRVTLADLAPTQARFLDFPFDAPDGTPLDEVFAEGLDRQPKVVVTVVWDGVGNIVLDEWPDAWPELRRMMDEGTWYPNAEVGSAPPSTAQIHATMGTGAFTSTHGLIGHHFRIGDRLVAPWSMGPRLLTSPTLADLYDRAHDNEPVVGVVAMVDIQLGMVGHGSLWGGGDKDVVALRERASPDKIADGGPSWQLEDDVAPFYELPAYLNDLPPISAYFDEVDRADGRLDGKWLDEPLDDPKSLYGFHTPARNPWQQRAIEEFVRQEGFGDDDVTDLLFLNFKLTDEVGHIHTLNSEYMRDALAGQDEALGNLARFLDAEIGEGEWLLALMADHGHTPDPEVTGATAIAPGMVAGAVNARFDLDQDEIPVVEFTQPTMLHVDETELAEHGATLEDVSAFILTLTKEQVSSSQWPGPPETSGDPAFEAAFPSTMLETLDCVPRDE
jgi:hypothetical protein